ncbi:NAD(P)/FAD-dependent oxidoreductase [Rhodosalinus sp. FB01]|uniref:NAD(P)/FAD-dependent oxidoreductase n=1 Tax=Rhodosalinus sp. FB01 TaxID=3239194 RepID=UPI003524D563
MQDDSMTGTACSGAERAAAGLWGASAEERAVGARLDGDVDADLCVVGGGVLGVAAALSAAEAGASVLLCEAGAIGLGATGRSGGQIWAGFKPLPGTLARDHDAADAARLEALAAKAPQVVFDLVERHQIRCRPDRRGTVVGVHSAAALPEACRKFDALRKDGQPVEWMDADTIAVAIGTPAYFGGWRHAAGGTVQPLSFVRGLARAAEAAGARLAIDTPATRLVRNGCGWRVETPRGTVRAGAVLLATNGYSGPLLPPLRRSVVPVESAQVATAPHPAVLEGRILSGIACVSDTRRSLLYFRPSPDGRLVMGGRGGMMGAAGRWRFGRLRARAEWLFPELAGCQWEEAWSGKVAMTLDSLPHVHNPEPMLFCALGFNGRGMALGTAFGTELGRALAVGASGAEDADFGVGLPLSPLREVPFHRLHRLGVAAVATGYLLRDLWDERPRNR